MAADTARLFFAAWPSVELQQALGKLARALQHECGGRALPERNIHLTLVFVGDVGRSRLPRLEALATGVSAPGFELAVNRVEYWRHNRIVWAGAGSCPGALQSLVGQMEQALAGEGFCFDRREYVPHITLLRNARRAPPETSIPAIAWPVTRFALVESVRLAGGRVYEVIEEWPLGT